MNYQLRYVACPKPTQKSKKPGKAGTDGSTTKVSGKAGTDGSTTKVSGDDYAAARKEFKLQWLK